MRPRASAVIALFSALLSSGCEGEPRPSPGSQKGKSVQLEEGGRPEKKANDPATAEPHAGGERTKLGRNVWLESKGKERRVVVESSVCLREGSYGLECLLCRRGTKEHESVLVSDAEGKFIHAALLAAGANAGSPVRYEDQKDGVKVIPPTGSRIKVLLQYQEKNKRVSVAAQRWVRRDKSAERLDNDWVFAGSRLYTDPDDKSKTIYAADGDGSFISILNDPAAILDLPINNPNRDPSEREYQPFTERIPEIGTKVEVILHPEPESKRATNQPRQK